jgi:hypothetical protein
VKPSQELISKSGKNAQRELVEHMRRPPRLGVGAPIPESSTHETARLKNQLTSGKKRARQEDDDRKQQPNYSDDDEESRAGVMKKKVRVDVFNGGKQKRKKVNGLFTPQSTPGSSQTRKLQGKGEASGEMEIDREEESQEAAALPASSGQVTSSPRKKKKRKKVSDVDVVVVKPTSPPSTPRQNTTDHLMIPISQDNASSVEVELSAAPVGSSSSAEMVAETNPPNTIDRLTTATPKTPSTSARVRTFQNIPALNKLPLLNLDGPPPDVSDPEGDKIPSQGASPKKKRKRHKKRKNSSSCALTMTGVIHD